MAELFHLPTTRVIDQNGIADGATLTFYLSGTSTPTPVYTTEALSIEHPNPLTVASGAAVPNIYLASGVSYRCIVKNAAGTTIDDIDPYLGLSSLGVVFTPEADDAVTRTVQDKLREIKTFEDFGAVGDGWTDGTGTDDTAAIQAALDWAYESGAVRAIHMTDKFFLCGNITYHPYTTIIGSGRQSSAFIASDAATGEWHSSRTNSGQKITLSGIAWYARSKTDITHILRLGEVGQHGTEGVLRELWVRDAPNGYGLWVDGNVSLIQTITAQQCKFPVYVQGGYNQVSDIVIMQPGMGADTPSEAVGAYFSGCHVRGVHLEAPAGGSIPLRIAGNVSISDVGFALHQPDTALGEDVSDGTFSHLIEVDTTNHIHWVVKDVEVSPNPNVASGTELAIVISNGLMKVGSAYSGGTSLTDFNGRGDISQFNVRRKFYIKNQEWTSASIQIKKTGATLQHKIRDMSGAAAGSFHSKINNASAALQNTATGSSAFAFGASITSGGNQLVLDLTAGQAESDHMLMANIVYNTTGTALTVWPFVATVVIGGVSKKRLALDFRNAADGTAFALSSIADTKLIEVQIMGFLA